MISFVLGMSLAMQSAEPPLTSVEVTVDRAVSEGPRYPYEVREQVGAYIDCLTLSGKMRLFREGVSQAQESREDLVRCEEQKGLSLRDSVDILSERRDREAVEQDMRVLFEDLGGWHIAQAKAFDEQLEKLMKRKSADEK